MFPCSRGNYFSNYHFITDMIRVFYIEDGIMGKRGFVFILNSSLFNLYVHIYWVIKVYEYHNVPIRSTRTYLGMLVLFIWWTMNELSFDSLWPSYHSPSQKSLPPLAAGSPLTQPNHPFSLGGTFCVLALVNIIPKFPKKNTSFCKIYHRNSVESMCLYVWL